jgi:tetratricopeptide (TPR) repeat protein
MAVSQPVPVATAPEQRQPATPAPAPTSGPAPKEDEVEKWARYLREHPDAVDAWVNVGDALMQRSREKGGGSLYGRAEAAYQKALRLDPRNVGGMVGMAWVCNSRHEFEEGCRWARKALELDAMVPDAHALLGDAAVEYGEYDKAFDHYQACLDIRPDLSSYARAAHLLWLTGDAARAKTLLRKAIAAGSPHAENTAWCRAELALMMFNTGALALAEKQVEEALTEAPANAHVLAATGRIKAGRKDYGAAIGFYERALASGALDLRTMTALAELYELTGDHAKAADMSGRVLAFHASEMERHGHGHPHPHGPEAHAHGNADLARFLADQDRDVDRALQEARSAYERLKSIYVGDTLAWCYYKTGDLERAKETILDVLRWNTPDASLLFHAGMIHAKLGDRGAARKYLYKALSLNPNFHARDAATAVEVLESLAGPPPESGAAEPR